MENNERNKVLINEKVLAKCLYQKKTYWADWFLIIINVISNCFASIKKTHNFYWKYLTFFLFSSNYSQNNTSKKCHRNTADAVLRLPIRPENAWSLKLGHPYFQTRKEEIRTRLQTAKFA